MYLNKAFIYGNLTRDPELKALPSGSKVVSFSIATNRSYKDKDGRKQEAVEYHNVVSFGKQAEVMAQYLKKGRPVLIEGRIQTRSWDDAAGKKNYRTEIVADNFQFGPSAPGTPGSAPAQTSTATASKAPVQDEPPMDSIQYPDEEINPDDIPF
jgi:single-strand DNA-binding protein